MANFYIADTHIGHENILKYDQQRPFADLGEMETALVRNWNRAVTDTDTVYILGDFIFGKDERWLTLTEKLRGRKVLVRGNHDLSWEQMSMELLARFEAVADYMEIVDKGRRVTLCHYPILFYHGSYRPNCYMLCGHVHATRENDYLERCRTQMRADPQAGRGNIYNVGCMMPWMDYTPRTLDEIILALDRK